jgi:hypothetical protein
VNSLNQAAYLFTAGVTSTQVRADPGIRGGTRLQTWDSLACLIVYGAEAARAQEIFENWCRGSQQEGEAPVEREIQKIVGAPIIDQLLRESGPQPLNWAELAETVMDSSVAAAEITSDEHGIAPDEGEGFWVDVNAIVPPKAAIVDLESLKHGLTEDTRSGLNWSADKQFLFLVSVLCPPPIPSLVEDDLEENELAAERGESSRQSSGPAMDEAIASLPQMRENEAAALIEARNSVVAAWLWRKFAADTRLVSNEILINACCGIMAAE